MGVITLIKLQKEDFEEMNKVFIEQGLRVPIVAGCRYEIID